MTPRELPIACSLDAARLRAREAELARLGRSLISADEPGRVPVTLRFTADPQTRERLDRIVAAERECCPFLDLRVREGETLELTIDGPEDAGPVIEGLTDAIRGSVTA
jgi:MerR family transcriptional regulator, copper efflux regulator